MLSMRYAKRLGGFHVSLPVMSPPADPNDEAPDDRDDRPADTIEPPTRSTDTDGSTSDDRSDVSTADDRSDASTADDRSDQTSLGADPQADRDRPTAGSERQSTPAQSVGDDPQLRVDSRWWYWVAAVPIYVLIGAIGSVLVAILLVGTIGLDILGGGGAFTGLASILLLIAGGIYGLAGLALLFLFPIGIYLDAKAIAELPVEWDPDPILYGGLAALSALFSAFTLSLFLALYYLYKRHGAIGEP